MNVFPRIIHQCFLGFDGPMPEKWSQNHKKWKELHSNFEIRLWNMEESLALIYEIDESFLKMFENYEYNIERADAIRYFILYKFGGIYVDLDIIPNYSIDSLLKMYENDEKLDVLLGESPNVNTASNFFMISKSQSKFWLYVIDEMKNRVYQTYLGKHFKIMNQTGPLLLNHVMNRYNETNEQYVEILPKSILNSRDVCGTCNTKFSYIIDQHSGSWNSFDSKILNFLNCKIYKPLKKINVVIYFSIIIVMFIIVLKSKRSRKFL